MLFSSCVLHVLQNYGKYVSQLGHHTIVTPLIPYTKNREYDALIDEAMQSRTEHLQIAPIFLRARDSRFSTLLNPLIFLRDSLAVLQVVRQQKPEAIICFYVLHAFPLALLKGFLGFSLAVVAMGGDVNLEKGFLRRLATKFICWRSDLIFAVSTELRDKLKGKTGRDAILIPTGVDSTFFNKDPSRVHLREKWGFRPDDTVILTVCGLIRRKGIDVLLESMSMLRYCRHGHFKLAIAGSGPEKGNLDKMVSELGLKKDVLFLGFRHRSELLELYNIADVFVLASHSEGLPFALLEAMACGCACVVTDVGDASKAIREGHNGFIASPGDPLSLKEKIEHILSLPEGQLHSLQHRARQTAVEGYDIRQLTRRMVETVVNSLPKSGEASA
ncbi:glycosyltransferase family 4 protein [Candidatus Bathyarchaeota archaeon]|nr:glycosyltransferase family 4 protein [Candidatus Bathyarchaeota archaeon]